MKKLALLALPLAIAAGESQAAQQLGTLDCEVGSGVGFIVGSTKKLTCQFTPAIEGLEAQTYEGRVDRIGLDVGVTGPSIVRFNVVATDEVMIEPGLVSGNYSGIGANAAVGLGVGANALVADDNENVALQPLSIQGGTGVNIAAGIQNFSLEPGMDGVTATSEADEVPLPGGKDAEDVKN